MPLRGRPDLPALLSLSAVLALAAALEGMVAGPDGKPVAGATVAARRVGEPAAHPAAGRTDAAGRFRLALSSASPHLVRVEAPGLAPRLFDAARPGTPLRVTLARGGEVEGVVRDAKSGAPSAG